MGWCEEMRWKIHSVQLESMFSHRHLTSHHCDLFFFTLWIFELDVQQSGRFQSSDSAHSQIWEEKGHINVRCKPCSLTRRWVKVLRPPQRSLTVWKDTKQKWHSRIFCSPFAPFNCVLCSFYIFLYLSLSCFFSFFLLVCLLCLFVIIWAILCLFSVACVYLGKLYICLQ